MGILSITLHFGGDLMTNYKKQQRGNTLVMVAIFVPALLAMAGLVLDWGNGAYTQSQLQKASDAAALAGASEIDNPSEAALKAYQIANANFVGVDNAVYQMSGNTYTVTLTENVPTFFMRILGNTVMEVQTTATAIAERPVSGLRGGGFPFAIINPDLNNDPNDDLTPWNYGEPYIIGYGEDNVMIQDWANGAAPPPGNGNGNGNGGNGNSNGWRAALGLRDDGTIGNCGASDVRNNLINGWPGTLNIGDVVPVHKGNMTGPISQGRDGLLGDNPLPWNDFDQKFDYKDSRVIMVPVIHLIHETRGDTYTMSDWNSGAGWDTQDVVVDGFAPFFILDEGEYEQYVDNSGNAGDWIVGYYIPGTNTEHFLVDGSPPDFGLYSPPRLID